MGQRQPADAIAQGSQSVGLNYDNANRRTCLTLPNGVIATYGYDSDSRIASSISTTSTKRCPHRGNGTSNAKRLTASIEVAARCADFKKAYREEAVRAAVRSYRDHMLANGPMKAP